MILELLGIKDILKIRKTGTGAKKKLSKVFEFDPNVKSIQKTSKSEMILPALWITLRRLDVL